MSLHYAYSQEPEKSDDCKYIDELTKKEEATIIDAWANGARAYVCGSRRVSERVGQAARELVEAGMQLRRERDRWSEEEINQRRMGVD